MRARFPASIMLLSALLLACDAIGLIAATPTAVPTRTPAPTRTPSFTATPTRMPATELLEQQEDGSWLIVDREAGFQFEMGSNWYLKDVSTLDLVELMQLDLTGELGIDATGLYVLQPEGNRVIGVYRDGAVEDYLSLAFSVVYIEDEGYADKPLDAILEQVIAILAEYEGRDPEEFDRRLFTNDHDLEFGAMIYNLVDDFYQTRFIIKLEHGFGMVIVGHSRNNMDAIESDVGRIAETLQYTEP